MLIFYFEMEYNLHIFSTGFYIAAISALRWAKCTSGKLQLKQEDQQHLEQVPMLPMFSLHRIWSQPWGLVHQVRLEQHSTKPRRRALSYCRREHRTQTHSPVPQHTQYVCCDLHILWQWCPYRWGCCERTWRWAEPDSQWSDSRSSSPYSVRYEQWGTPASRTNGKQKQFNITSHRRLTSYRARFTNSLQQHKPSYWVIKLLSI